MHGPHRIISDDNAGFDFLIPAHRKRVKPHPQHAKLPASETNQYRVVRIAWISTTSDDNAGSECLILEFVSHQNQHKKANGLIKQQRQHEGPPCRLRQYEYMHGPHRIMDDNAGFDFLIPCPPEEGQTTPATCETSGCRDQSIQGGPHLHGSRPPRMITQVLSVSSLSLSHTRSNTTKPTA